MKNTRKLLSLVLLAACAAVPYLPQKAWAYAAAGVSKMDVYTSDNLPAITVTGYCNQFGTCGTPTIGLNGSTSGTLTLQAPATAGTNTLTLPATTDTIATTANLAPNGTISTQGVAFSTGLTGNPLLLNTYAHVPSAAALNSGFVVIASQSGRTIYPNAGLIMMASGTPATCTNIRLYCAPSQRLLVSAAVAALTTNVPAGATSSNVTLGSGMGFGCAAGDAVLASQVGATCTTMSDFYISLPYTVQ